MTAMAYPHQWRGPSAHKRCGVALMTRHGRHGGRHGFGPGGPGPGGGFGPPFGPRGRRAARGDVRAAVLLLLDEEPRNGYALMQEIEERSEGVWRPSPGSIYPALAQLEDEGLVQATKEGSGRVFELTDAGREHVESKRDELGEPWKAVSGGFPKEAGELRDLVMQLGAAAMQVVQAGTTEQRRKAVEHLTEARRGLYRILAEDSSGDE
jgi:DNA-binding PadR family transcriptional regulator